MRGGRRPPKAGVWRGIFRGGTQKRAKPEEKGSVETHSQGKARFWVVGETGLEPATSCSQSKHSSQLSYSPERSEKHVPNEASSAKRNVAK